MKILIADDDLTIRSILEAMTTRWGLQPIIVEDGEAAWAVLQQDDPPRILLLDWEMPKLDGLQLSQRIRQQATEDPPYILLLTARSEAEDIAEGLAAGANDFIAKPFKNVELQARINVAKRMLKLQYEHIQALADAQLAASVFTHTFEGIVITDTDGMIIRVNNAFTSITGYAKEEAIGRNSRFLVPKAHSAAWQEVLDTGRWSGEVSNGHKNGSTLVIQVTVVAVKNTNGLVTSYIGLFSDITERARHQEALNYAATHDPLTDLANRTLLKDRTQQAMAHVRRDGKALALVYIDLDGFKMVNDTFGHEEGDKLLVSLAKHMNQLVRETDTVARIGGDEFVVLLTELTDNDSCLLILYRLLAAATTSIEINDMQAKVSASIGVSIFIKDDDITADELLQQADTAMYQAKTSGKNCYVFYDKKEIQLT